MGNDKDNENGDIEDEVGFVGMRYFPERDNFNF
jgi:hypothetical protein